MTPRFAAWLRIALLVAIAAWAARNVSTTVWYGMASMDWAGSVTELPLWTKNKAIEQMTLLQNKSLDHAIISDASDQVVATLEAAHFTGSPLFFFGSYLGPFSIQPAPNLNAGIARFRAATTKALDEHNRFYTARAQLVGELGNERWQDSFPLDPRLRDAALHPDHILLLESLNTTLFNTWKKPPDFSGKIFLRPYADVRDYLVYVPSVRGTLGMRNFTLETMLWRFESDSADPSKSMEAVGRYLLFNVINPVTPFRLELSVTATVLTGDRSTIPPASVVGTRRFLLAPIGHGAARLFSPPITPQVIRGLSFIELDMGRDGAPFPDHRQGIMKLYGTQQQLDPRRLTAFIRDISIVTEEEYRSLRSPHALTSFPRSLEDPNLEFSGLYEDGWMAERAAVWLSAPERGPGTLTVRAMLPYQAVKKSTEVTVTIDGRTVATVRPAPGDLVVRVRANDDGRRHEIQIRANTTFRLPNDGRPASMLIKYLGFD